MKIISFTGPKSSGKDTAAAILEKAKISKGKISFAGPLKEICSKVFGIPLKTFEDPKLKEKPFEKHILLTGRLIKKVLNEMVKMLDPYSELDYNPTITLTGIENLEIKSPRQLLQVVGTDVIRNRVHPDWHVAAAFSKERLSKLDSKGTYCVTDARFPNEYSWLKEHFKSAFIGFYVERPKAEKQLEKATHVSELAVKDVKVLMSEDQILKNDGSIKDFKKVLLAKNYEVAMEADAETKRREAASKFKFKKAGRYDEGSF